MEQESVNPEEQESGPELGPGDSIGRYKLLRRLGRGGMGDVFTAEDPDLNREIAIKVLPASMAANESLVRRFEREAQAIAKLEHPNIVTIYSVERAEGVQFITMQLVDGDTLRAPIQAGGSPQYEFFDLAIQMADAVGSAHERGIIHRDLKPENILVTGDGRVMILDFGLAKLREEAEPRGISGAPSHLTTDGLVVGTMDYMSPEQAEGREVDHRSDIFSLGIVLFELATGEHPFRGESNLSVISAILKDPARSTLEIKADLPRQLDRILQLTLEKNREQRTQSMKDLRNQLESLKRETSSIPRAGAARRRLPLGLMLGAFLAGAAVALGVGAGLGGSGEAAGTAVELGAIRRIAGDADLEVHPAISPSGKMIAYAKGPIGQRKLYVKHVSGGKPVALTAQYEGNHLWPQWSPDESQIAFEAGRSRWLISPFPSDRRALEGADGAGGLTWSADGQRVAYTRDDALIVRAFSGGEELTVVSGFRPNSPCWSPDGSKIAYVLGNDGYHFAAFDSGNIAPSSIWVVSSTGGEPVQVIAEGALNLCPQWLDDEHLVFISDRHGRNDLYLIRLDGTGTPSGDPERITAGMNAYSFTLSQDRRLIAFCESTRRANIWKLPIPEPETTVSVRDAVPVTFGSQVIEGMDVSSDGQWIVFDSNRGGNQDIYKLRLPDGEQQLLTIDPAGEFIPSFSLDGEEVVFHSFTNGNRDVYVMGADGTGVTQVTTLDSEDRYGTWSPDGNSLVFHSTREERFGLWSTTRTERGGTWSEPRLLMSMDGDSPAWSPDGALIAFGTGDGASWTVTPEGEDLNKICGSEVGLAGRPYLKWSRDGEQIYFKGWRTDGRAQVWAAARDGSEVRELVIFDDPSKSSGRAEFGVDGESLYFTLAERQMDVFTIELDFRPGS